MLIEIKGTFAGLEKNQFEDYGKSFILVDVQLLLIRYFVDFK
jgi:hypothetical protein